MKCADVMLEQLARERDPLVLRSIGAAFGHLQDARAVAPLVALVDHPDEEVRHGVVMGLLGHPDPAAVNALIQLSGDVDDDVRKWATFGLGSQLEDVDTPALREALVQRLQDRDVEARGEALVGLARRKDGRVLDLLRRELAGPDVIVLTLEAAEALGDPSLLPLLVQLRNSPGTVDSYFVQVLDAAITALAAVHGSPS